MHGCGGNTKQRGSKGKDAVRYLQCDMTALWKTHAQRPETKTSQDQSSCSLRWRGRNESTEGSPNQCFLFATWEKVGHLGSEGDGNDELN